ncbi:MAG: response regulator [Candidatus Omnitrophica bacterium]|nr:response regulator [Candidatus Omnitrophota bacterium]
MPKTKILMIDDNIKFLELIKLNLEDTQDFEVRAETKSSLGLSAALIFKPDIIILDIVMGDQDGSSVAKQLKDNPKTQYIPIIYLIGILKESEEHAPLGFLGQYPCISKPASTKKIIACIENKQKSFPFLFFTGNGFINKHCFIFSKIPA